MQRCFNTPKAESLSCYKNGEYKESILNIKHRCNNPVRYDLTKDLKSVLKRVLIEKHGMKHIPAPTPVDTRRRFNVYKPSIRRRRRCIDVL